METITYLNLKTDVSPINRLLSLKVENAMNRYGTAKLEGEVEYEAGNKYIQHITPQSTVKITTSAAGQPETLFMGVVRAANVRKEQEYAVLELTLDAVAATLDKEKENKSFQKKSSTYEQVVSQAFNGRANLEMRASDHASGSLIMQYNETAWEFAKRMASQLGAPICADTTAPKPKITIGVPDTGKSYELSDVEFGFASEDDSVSTKLTSGQAVEIGDKVSYGGSSSVVRGYVSEMAGGVLRTTAYVMPETEALGMNAGNVKGQEAQPNGQAAGKMFTGMVQAVKQDKVQVHLTDIDASYDSGGDFWFPYSTAYSSSDGSGFYCMPAVGDTVRVFFPSGSEGDAFAASSVNVSPLDNPVHKKWRSPAGKEILLTEEGMYITCKEQRIFINMEDEYGITIHSDKDINVNSMTNMMLYAKEGITLHAENKILISTGESYIDITDKLIQMGAQQIMIN